MIIPLTSDRPLRRPTQITFVLIALNVGVFVVGQAMGTGPSGLDPLADRLMLDPRHFRWWMLTSYAFAHGGLFHLLGNMLFLWVFGPNVEDRLGRIGFAALYLFGAAAAAGVQMASSRAPVVGASGAVAAVTGAFLVLFPRTHIRTLVFFILIGVFMIPAWWFIGARIAWDLLAQAMGSHGVARMAHLGGYAFGAGVAMGLLATGAVPREPCDLFSLSRHARRRRAFREVSFQHERERARAEARVARPAGPDPVAEARAAVTEPLARGDENAALDAYRRFIDEHADREREIILGRRAQYDIANLLFRRGEHASAAAAYELFLTGYPDDAEAPVVHLMIGVLSARYLNDPVRAQRALRAALEGLDDDDHEHRALAREILDELG